MLLFGARRKLVRALDEGRFIVDAGLSMSGVVDIFNSLVVLIAAATAAAVVVEGCICFYLSNHFVLFVPRTAERRRRREGLFLVHERKRVSGVSSAWKNLHWRFALFQTRRKRVSDDFLRPWRARDESLSRRRALTIIEPLSTLGRLALRKQYSSSALKMATRFMRQLSPDD